MPKSLLEKKNDPPGWKGNVYFTSGKVDSGPCYGIKILKDGRVVFPPLDAPKTSELPNQPLPEPMSQPIKVLPDILVKLSVTKCLICDSPIPGKREDRKFCSPRCRQIASRKNRQLELIKL
jgi:hypothetical protein